mgnify:CR=1 FL=1|jgi:hypothetical protein
MKLLHKKKYKHCENILNEAGKIGNLANIKWLIKKGYINVHIKRFFM